MENVCREPRLKHRRITLHKERILHDIDILSYKLSETVIPEGEARDGVASDVADRVDGAVLGQLMETREAALRKKLAFCLHEEKVFEVDNEIELNGDFVFNFKLPVRFNDADLKVAVRIMHDYLVNATLMDWYTRIGTNYGASLAEEVLQKESRIVDIFRVPGFVHHPHTAYVPSYKIR